MGVLSVVFVVVMALVLHHCMGVREFKVDLVTFPRIGGVVVDLNDEDPQIQSCDTDKDEHNFICQGSKLLVVTKFKQTDFKVNLTLNLKDGNDTGIVVIHVGPPKKKKVVPSNQPVSGTVGKQKTEMITLMSPMTLQEELKPGTGLLLFTVNGIKGTDKVKYSLTGKDSKYIKIDEKSGKLTSGEPVERDGPKGLPYIDDLILTVMVNGKTIAKPLNVSIGDINDNPPIFLKETWFFEAKENSTKRPISTLKCSDLDTGDNSRLKLSIVSPPGITVFSMVGQTLLAESLDYEALRDSNGTYRLTVIAVDQPKDKTKAKTATTTVIVKVLPTNEFSPVWKSPFQGGSGVEYTHTVYRNTIPGNVIFTLKAVDEDAGPDGIVVYALEAPMSTSGSRIDYLFMVKEVTGQVHVLKQMMEPSYTFTVSATDKGAPNKTINATVKIIVADPPSGLSWTHEGKDGNVDVSLTEKSDAILTTVSAKGSKGEKISYTITSVQIDGKGDNILRQVPFYLNNDGKLLKLQSFKFYNDTGAMFYSVGVDAVADGTGNKISCTITIKLPRSSVNHPPEWESPFTGGDGSTATVTVSEKLSPGSVVTMVKAKDKDNGREGELTYRIGSVASEKADDATQKFSFDPNSGELRVLADLDLEKGSKSFTAVISAIDNGTPPLSIKGILTIKVSDVNEFPPVLDKPLYKETVGCELQPTEDVLKIGLSDKDATSDFKVNVDSTPSEFVGLKMIGQTAAAVFLLKHPPPQNFANGPFSEVLQFTVSDGGKTEKTVNGFAILNFEICSIKPKPTTEKPKPTVVVTKPQPKPQPTERPEPDAKTSEAETQTQEQEPEVTTDPDMDDNSTEMFEFTDVTATDGYDVTDTSEKPLWEIPVVAKTTTKTELTTKKNVNLTKPTVLKSSGGGGGSEAANWVVRTLCIILFLGYVGLGGLYIFKKFSPINLNCLRPKTAVHPQGDPDPADNAPGGSVVDYSDRHAEAMPDITAALAIASPNFMENYPRELPQPPATAAPSPALPSLPVTPIAPSVQSTTPLPPIPSILTEPPPAVPPLSTTTSQMPPKFLPPLPEGARKLPET